MTSLLNLQSHQQQQMEELDATTWALNVVADEIEEAARAKSRGHELVRVQRQSTEREAAAMERTAVEAGGRGRPPCRTTAPRLPAWRLGSTGPRPLLRTPERRPSSFEAAGRPKVE